MTLNDIGVATLSISTLTAGLHAISAAFTTTEPTVFYNSQMPGATNIMVVQPTLTITVNAKINVYGSNIPSLTPKITGFVNGQTALIMTSLPTITTTATASSPLGNYPITVTGGAAPGYLIRTSTARSPLCPPR